MGGGGVMRAAAKVAGIGVVNNGIRGGIISGSLPAEQSIRNSSRPVSTVLSSSSTGATADVAAVNPLYSEFDDWELAGGENDPFLNSGEPLPRVVFGGVPSLEEAKEATADLKDALEKVYLTPSTCTESSDSIEGGQISSLSLTTNSGHVDAKGYSVCEQKVAMVPQYAMKAFALLNESPAVQSVVASIASDPKVWDAVMQNESLVELLQNQKTDAEPQAVEKSIVDKDQETPGKFTESSEESQAGNFETMFKDVCENIKVSIVKMVSNVTSFLQNIFGVPSGEHSSASSAENGGLSTTEKTLGASLLGLAVMVIMVVVLKRG